MRAKTPGSVALVFSWAVLGLFNVTGLGLFLYVVAAVNPRSDAAAGLTLVSTILAWLGDFVAFVLACVGGYRGRARTTAIVSAVCAGLIAIGSGVVAPIAALGWALATSPVPIH